MDLDFLEGAATKIRRGRQVTSSNQGEPDFTAGAKLTVFLTHRPRTANLLSEKSSTEEFALVFFLAMYQWDAFSERGGGGARGPPLNPHLTLSIMVQLVHLLRMPSRWEIK